MNLKNLLLSVAAIAATPLFATTYYVTPEGAGSKDGSSWENAFDTEGFREQALKNADGDVYELAAGTYKPSACIIFKKLSYATINGSTKGRTILSGDKNDDGNVTNDDLNSLIRFQTNTGAGVTTKPVVINNVDFTSVYTKVDNDNTTDGPNEVITGVNGIGALYVDNCGSVTVTNCNFYENLAEGERGGAAAHCRRSTVKFLNCIFRDNSANFRGGALRITSDLGKKGQTTIENCIFKNNTNNNEFGGAIYQGYGHYLNIVNSTFYGNKCANRGAAIFANSSTSHPCEVRIVNSTIAGNTITGENLNGQVASSQYANIHITNSIIASNDEKTADIYFNNKEAANEKFSFISGGYNYVGNVVDMANQTATTAEDVTEPVEKIKWQSTDNVGAENTYASIFGDNTLNSDNQLVPVKYVAGASGEQVTSATADWGLPTGLSLAKDAAGNTRAAGMTPGANSYTEQQIKDFTTGVISIIDDAANAPRLVKVANDVYTVEGTTEGITVYTVNGATVAATSGTTIDLSSFANGLYIIKSGNAIFKVMK